MYQPQDKMTLRLTIFVLLIIAFAEEVTCKKLRQEIVEIQSGGNGSGKRTLLIGKLVLLPILAGIGVKLLVLLPIILSKIALLGILSFVSSNLSLLVSAVLGVRSYFFDDKKIDEDHDYEYRNKNGHEFYEQNKYVDHKNLYDDHRLRGNDYDAYDKHMHRYKSYKSLHPGYNPHYAEYKGNDDHNSSKKRFRPFKLLGRIKDVIKDHFHKSEGHGQRYREYDHDQKHYSREPHNDYDKYDHKSRETKYRNSGHSISNHNHDQNGGYHETYVVPESWSQKKGSTSISVVEDETNEENFTSMTERSDGTQLASSVRDDPGKLLSTKLSTLPPFSPTAYKVDKDYEKFKEPFIVLGIRPYQEDSDSPVAFYATDYKITDFHSVPQADTGT